ncbi:casein kinase 2 regulatory subunit [Lodderomyces elongisporus]|uniref:casein kinase 2 regulatory subunit n=1 Tax=Lodderomyces elongisporus TaxID=36914 RepID=UPI002924A119|nr:casein kinase 2 regulatory subunit [Lodderomyces elongisporus]WLF77445.1 casein kinase 2 regulatory subunit [Lodderomyces elongisporus]
MPSDLEDEYVPWIQQFCELFGHDYFVQVSQDFIEDDFNLTGLSSQVPFYREALYTILDYQVETAEDHANNTTTTMAANPSCSNNHNNSANMSANNNNNNESSRGGASMASKSKVSTTTPDLPNKALLMRSAELLYGLIHARYIVSKQGLTAMASKFEKNDFGSCPRYFCDGMHLIPVGSTDIPGQETVRLYCPCCNDIYLPSSSRYLNIDGAYFGTTFPGLLVKMFPEIENQCRIRINKFSQNDFGLKLFGFKINELSSTGPRMKWLRMHPKTLEEKKEYDFCEYSVPKLAFDGEDDDDEEEDDDDDDEMEDDDDEEDEGQNDDDKTMASE